MAKKMPSISAPVPGQSLTAEPGSRPWENPPKYARVEDALEFYLDDLSQPEKLANALDKIEEGAPIGLLVNTLQTLGTSKGLHSLDVGVLISPVLIEFYKSAADQEGISYTIGDEDQGKKVSRAEADMIVKGLMDKSKDTDETAVVNTENEDEEEQKTGLMARRDGGSEEPAMEEEV